MVLLKQLQVRRSISRRIRQFLAVGCLVSTGSVLAGPTAAVVNRVGGSHSLVSSVGRMAWNQWSDPKQAATEVPKDSMQFRSTCGMDREMVTLFLQSYNAGPYAVTRFNGQVPYRETRAYTPKVLRFYAQDLSHTEYDALIVASAERHGLDPQLVRAIMKAESNFRNRTTSHAGARGLMQVMPVTWNAVRKRNGITWNYSSHVFEPAKNIEVACAYLSWIRYEHLPKHFAQFQQAPKSNSTQGTAVVLARLLGTRETKAQQPTPLDAPSRRVPGAVASVHPRRNGNQKTGIQFSWSR